MSAQTTDDSITMLYNILPGASDQSYGIHVARLAQFPPKVLEEARRKVRELESGEGSGTVEENEADASADRKRRSMITKLASLDADNMTTAELEAAVRECAGLLD